MKIWKVDFFDMTDGRRIVRTEHFAEEAMARAAAAGWMWSGRENARVMPVDVRTVPVASGDPDEYR